jgi:hypothetical protein
MSTKDCSEFLERFEAWMEGDRPAEARAHVSQCPSCRYLVEDMDSIRLAAHAWSAEQTDPPARLWVSLRAQLEREGLIRDAGQRAVPVSQTDQAERPRGWFAGIFTIVPRPALAGAYLLALVAACVALTGPSARQLNESRWISGTQDSTGTLSAQLQTAERDSVSAMAVSDPVVTASLHDNLAIVDNYIALCEKSVREEPESEIARDYLYDAYEQKANLLAQMTERGVNGR